MLSIALFVRKSLSPGDDLYKYNGHIENLIPKYIGMHNILKRKCHVGINVVFIEVIATV